MKIVLITGSPEGSAPLHLQALLENAPQHEYHVITGKSGNGKRLNKIKRKLKKIWKIGLLGAAAGYRMRNWYDLTQREDWNTADIYRICELHNIPCHRCEFINSEVTAQLIRDMNPDLGISSGNGFLSPKIFNLPKFGMINIHHALLPQYRNAQSIIWELYNQSLQTGFTVHRISREIDGGAILNRTELRIELKESLKETVSYNYFRLNKASAATLPGLVNNLEMLIEQATPQAEGQAYTTPSFRQYRQIVREFNRLKLNSDSAD